MACELCTRTDDIIKFTPWFKFSRNRKIILPMRTATQQQHIQQTETSCFQVGSEDNNSKKHQRAVAVLLQPFPVFMKPS